MLVAALGVSLVTPDRLHVAVFVDPTSESAHAIGALHQTLGYDPQPGLAILARSPAGFDAPAGRNALTRLARRLARDPDVGDVRSAVGTRSNPSLISQDHRRALLLVHLRQLSEDAVAGPLDRLRKSLHEPGLDLSFGGYSAGFLDANRAARTDLVRAELIAFPLLAVLLLLIFRGVVAAAIPLAVGGVSVAGTFALLRLLAQLIDVSVFALNLAALLGLGLAVDYGLLMVSRFREEVAASGDRERAVRTTVSTAGRTVLMSALAVSAASAVLLLFPEPFIYSMGIAGVAVPLLCAGVALALVPPLLARVGERIGTARSGAPSARWTAWARWVVHHHRAAAQVAVALLIALAAQALTLRTTLAAQEAIPRSFESRQVADTVDRDFTPHLLYPVEVAIGVNGRSASAASQLIRLRQSLLAAPGVARADPPERASDQLAVLSVTPRFPPYSPESKQLVRQLRALRAPILVGGATASFVDLERSVSKTAPLAALLAALAVAVALAVITRSIVLTIKTVLVAAMSQLALIGAMVLLFQHGGLALARLIGYDGPPAVELATAVVVIAIALGLAVDYSILLLARISEEHRAGLCDEEAIVNGVRRTGPVITSAALLLAAALLAGSTSRIFPVQQLTIALALGVLLDATLVRMVLVPSSMRLLGSLNWWVPRWSRRRDPS